MKTNLSHPSRPMMVTALLGATFATCFAAHAMKWDDLPEAVRTTILANGGVSGQPVDQEDKSSDGKDVYEAGVKGEDGQIADLVVAEDGKLLEVKHDDTADKAAEVAAAKKPADAASAPPPIDPANFSEYITNPYLTFKPGTTFTYKSKDDEGTEVDKVTVTDQTKKVMGVTTRVVWDRVWQGDALIEETYDWYAQDAEGNVWYFGEDSRELENGKVVSTGGSWEAGVDGAQPGIAMPADPKPGDPYRQEYKKGEAEDMGQVLSASETVEAPTGTYRNCVQTKDWSPLEPGTIEHKYYSKEVGNCVLETEGRGGKKRVELVAITTE